MVQPLAGSKRESKARESRLQAARAAVLRLPRVQEGTSYGTPAFRVGGKLLARLHQDGESLVVRVDFEAREALLRANPDAFFVTDHYRGHPWVLVRLKEISAPELEELLETAWRQVAPRGRVGRGPS